MLDVMASEAIMIKRIVNFTSKSLLTAGYCLLAVSGNLNAAALTISEEPLFLQSGVQPNVLFVVDDSGSMDREVLFTEGARVAHSDTDDASGFDRQVYNGSNFNSSIASELNVRRVCSGYNASAYDPSLTYTPWEGADENGLDYTSKTKLNRSSGAGSCPGASCDRAAPLNNPYDNDDYDNLTDHMYVTWIDNGDGVYQNGECPSFASINTVGSVISIAECDATPRCFRVSQLTAAQQENYANWYTYYRNRDYVAKRAISSLVDSSSYRMGMGTINRNTGTYDFQSVGLPITDMTDPAVDSNGRTNKDNLLREVSRINPASSTPLRRALNRAGQYYQNGTGSLFSSSGTPGTPILTEALGGECQQNFTILLSDGFWRGLNQGVGNRDNDGGTGVDDTVFDGGAYADNVAETLADVAMKYYEEDLSSTLDNGVPELGRDDNRDGTAGNMHQHMVTYTVAFGVNGTLTADPADEVTPFTWPSPFSGTNTDPKRIDDMRHAAYNARGEFLSAANPQQLIDQLEASLDSIDDRASSSAAVAANSTSLSANSVIYQAQFNTANWDGQLRAFKVSDGNATTGVCAGTPIGQVCSPADWSAADQLDTQVAVTGSGGSQVNGFDTKRFIMTYKPSTDSGIPFRWPATFSAPGTSELDAAQVNALLGNAPAGDEQAYGQALLNFFRGDRANEEGAGGSYTFRDRASVLGDIVNAAPGFVGAPRFDFPDGLEANAYSTFQSVNAARSKMVYVAANDGMLHGFAAEDNTVIDPGIGPRTVNGGDEVFAYVPSFVYSRLEGLSEVDFTHNYILDGTPTIGDAYFSGAAAWRTVLVSGAGAGGQGIYALNVTDPDLFDETQANIDQVVLWEFTDADDAAASGDANLGYTYSAPDIVKLNNSGGDWAAIFGNGYNNTEADGNASTTGHATLFILNLETGAVIREISTGTGSLTTPNGLNTVTPVDLNGDATVDYVYGGDLLGNVWRFDLTDSDPANWTATRIFTTNSPDTGNPAQPITSRPSVAFHPDPQRDGFLIYFGTGRYIDVADNNTVNQTTQTFYAVWDDLASVPPALDRSQLPADSDYLQQTITRQPTIQDVNNSDVVIRLSSDNDIDWGKHHGWFMDLVNTDNGNTDNKGEKQVTNSIVRGDRIVFTTLIPDQVACNFGGSSFLMELDSESGGVLSEPALDINNDGVIDQDDTYTVVIDGVTVKVPASGIGQDGILTEPTIIGSDADKEFKLFNSSTGNTISILEKPPGGLDGSRNSWIELQ